jgi:DNA-binding CsgD family transcriptional regulator
MSRPVKNFLLNVPKNLTTDATKSKVIEAMIAQCDAVSCLINQSVYLVDYIRQKFLYVSPHPLFLCGYTAEEVKAMGFSFLEKILPSDDMQMFSEIYKMFWQFTNGCTPEEKSNLRGSYDIRIRHKNGDIILVNKKIAPLLFTEDGHAWIGMGIVTPSPSKEPYYMGVLKNKSQYVRYDFDKKKFVPYIPKKLTKREEEVLRLVMQGYSEVEISNKLNISVITVRHHRHNAQKKLGVNTLANAVGKVNLVF